MLLTWYAPIFVFPSAFERIPVRCSPRGASFLPEVALARGPMNEGQTGDGSYAALFSSNWALVWRRGGDLELYQLVGAEWFQRNPLGALPMLPDSSRHVSLAFDQSARPVVAWEDSGNVFVRQFDAGGGAYVVRGPFAGVDPLLMCDALLLRQIPGSDVVLFHLTADRVNVRSRIQNSSYAVASSVAGLSEAAFMDQVLTRGAQFELIFGTAGGLEFALRSAPYPYSAFDVLTTATATPPTTGAYVPIVIVRDLGSDNLTTTTATPPTTGAYVAAVIVQDLGSDNLTTTTATPPTTGAYVAAVIVQDLGSDNLTTTTATPPTTGSYELAVVAVDFGTDNLTTASMSAPTGGTYAAV